MQAHQPASVRLLQSATIPGTLAVKIPITRSPQGVKRGAAIPQRLVARSLFIRLWGGIGKRQILVLLDVGRPAAAGEVRRRRDRAKFARSFDEVELWMELRSAQEVAVNEGSHFDT